MTDKRWGWFAYRRDGTRDYLDGGNSMDVPKQQRPDPDEGGVQVRMFVDDMSGIGLWLLPGSRYLESTLPISDDLRARIEAWVDEYTHLIWEQPDLVDHDRRGLALSVELLGELGEEFLVDYHFNTREVQDEQGQG